MSVRCPASWARTRDGVKGSPSAGARALGVLVRRVGLVGLVGLGCWLAPVACVTAPPASPPETAGHPSERPVHAPFLWSVEKDGQRSYLLGTVHVGVDAERALPAMVWERFHGPPCFVMESDQDEIKPQALLAMATLPPGKSLRSMVTADVWAALAKRLDGKMGAASLARSQPWFVAVAYMQTQLPAGEPMDAAFLRRAREAGKHVAYLEDWREALGAFARVTDADDLTEMVRNDATSDADTQRLIAAYRSGDEGQLAAVLLEMLQTEPHGAEKNKILIEDRNALWLPRLIAQLKDRRCFVAVGAGHLVGPHNLRELLQHAGYRIERLR